MLGAERRIPLARSALAKELAPWRVPRQGVAAPSCTWKQGEIQAIQKKIEGKVMPIESCIKEVYATRVHYFLDLFLPIN
jgi:hypothetical protein